MPKGVKNVDWTNSENQQKLLLAIVKVCDIPNKYEEIAVAFGDGVPAKSISRYICKLRGMAKESKTAITAAMPKKSDGLMSGLKTAPKIKGKGQAKNVETSDDEPDSTDLGLQAVTPPKTPHPMVDKIISGRVTKRVSPRKTSIKDYKKIEDPFMELEAVKGDDGENVFGKPDLSEEDDSDPSDEEYGHKMTTVKTEEIL